MTSLEAPRIAAHLIIGKRDEPFLASLLSSLQAACQTLIVNDNSGNPHSANRAALQASAFAQNGSLIIDDTAFSDFATARNICLARHREHNAGEWIAFVDADEVHTAEFSKITSRLANVPLSIARIDGYTTHFFQSFDWYASIERRLSLFRFSPDVVWHGAVHEQLIGLRGAALALPYVYAHYGHVFSVERHAEKESQYARLGAKGDRAATEELDDADPLTYFADTWLSLMPYRGRHPAAAIDAIARLRVEYAAQFMNNEAIIQRHRGNLQARARRLFWQLNFDMRWRSRLLNPLAAALCSAGKR